jgi:hypothetical protein
MGVTAIVELLAFISSDETLGAFPHPTILAIAPDSDQKSVSCCPPRNYHRAQVHASCIAFLADQIRSMSWDAFDGGEEPLLPVFEQIANRPNIIVREVGFRGGFGDGVPALLEGADFAHQLERARVTASL